MGRKRMIDYKDVNTYRCVVCGRPCIIIDTNNQDEIVCECSYCDIEFTYTIPYEIKKLIEWGIIDTNSRERLSLNGVSVSCGMLKDIKKKKNGRDKE